MQRQAAIKSVGDNNSNSLAIGTFLEADIDGGLVYKVFILDPDSPENLNILTLDPSNGRVTDSSTVTCSRNIIRYGGTTSRRCWRRAAVEISLDLRLSLVVKNSDNGF